jgi:acyl-CoA synthetase (NDP forming)
MTRINMRKKHEAAEGAPTGGQVPVNLDHLSRSPSVTIVGARPIGATRHLVRNLTAIGEPFGGQVNLVARHGFSLNGLPSIPDISEVAGELGILWLLLNPDRSLNFLESLDREPRGVVAYGGGFGESGNEIFEKRLRDWSAATGVPVFGPQSTGLAFVPENLWPFDFFVKDRERLRSGGVSIVTQSGGIAGAVLERLIELGVGVDSVISMGSSAVIDFAGIIQPLLARSSTKILACYLEGIGSVRSFAAVARAANRAGKPIVLAVGGDSDIGRVIAQSHTGSLAVQRELINGISEQYGVVLVRDLGELPAAVDVLDQVDGAKIGNGRIGVFSGSGGFAAAWADTLSKRGITLDEPTDSTRATLLGAESQRSANPFDTGAGLVGKDDTYAELVRRFVSDPEFDIVVNVLGAVLPDEEHPHVVRTETFVREARASQKLAFHTLLFGDAQTRTWARARENVILAAGPDETVAKLRALQAWSRANAEAEGELVCEPTPIGTAMPSDDVAIVTGAGAERALDRLPVRWPGRKLIPYGSEVPGDLGISLPVIAKAEIGAAHRDGFGAVLGPLHGASAVQSAISYLFNSFACDVTLYEYIPHDEEYFVGVTRTDEGMIVLAAGKGGKDITAGMRLLPTSRDQLSYLVQRYCRGLGADQAACAVLAALQDLIIRRKDIASIDLNPLINGPSGLYAVDAKVHVRAGTPNDKEH